MKPAGPVQERPSAAPAPPATATPSATTAATPPAATAATPSATTAVTASVAEPFTGLRRIRRLLRSENERIRHLLAGYRRPLAARAALDRALWQLDRIDAETTRHRPVAVAGAVVLLPAADPLPVYLDTVLAASTFAAEVTVIVADAASPETRALYRLLETTRTGRCDEPGTEESLPDAVQRADVVVHTGAYPQAERLRHRLAAGQLFRYLGQGINPVVVAPGADPHRAAGDLVDAGILRLGRRRLVPGPVLVHTTGLDRFLRVLDTELTAAGRYSGTGYQPLESDEDCTAAADLLLRHGATVIHGGQLDFAAGSLTPTVLYDHDAQVPALEAREPVPGVLTVVPYDNPDTLATALNRGRFAEYALGATVYGDDPVLAEALARLRTVSVDRSLDAYTDDGGTVTGRGPMAGYAAYRSRLVLAPGSLIAVAAATLGRAG